MVSEDRCCAEVLRQVGAIQTGLRRAGWAVLERHVRGCVRRALARGQADQAVSGLARVLGRVL